MASKSISLALIAASLLVASNDLQALADSRTPRHRGGAPNMVLIRPMEPKNVPDFAPAPADQSGAGQSSGTGAPFRVGAESATLPVETRLKLVVEYAIDAKTSQPGDIFEAHTKDDIFLGRTLILPRGSLVRGRVSEITKPRLLSRAGKIGLRLEQICTPTGEVIPLDAALEFQKGMTNKKGQLDPGTSFGSKVSDNVKAVTGLSEKSNARGALMAANIATLGAPAVATAIGTSAIALFSTGDNISLTPGQELEILLTNDLGLQLN